MNQLIQKNVEIYDLPYTYEIMEFNNHESNKMIAENNLNPLVKGCLAHDDILVKTFDTSFKADKWDCLIAASSGLVTAMLNNFWLGDFSLTEAHKWGKSKTDKFVIHVAENQGYKGNNLKDAIRFLEHKFPLASDKLTADFGGGLQHHLRDFSHHPTIAGLVFSLLSQFTEKGYGTNVEGEFVALNIVNKEVFGKNIGEKILFGTFNWLMHLISDMDGSSSSFGEGTGIPGFLLSFLKEISVLPLIKDIKCNYKEDSIGISLWLSKLFNGTHYYLNDKGEKIRFDLRTEIGILNNLGKGVVPVLANEAIVRCFYFIRRLYLEIQKNEIQQIKDLNKIDYVNVLPYNNRALTRMLTISSGVFVTVTTGTATAKSAIKNKGDKVGFTRDLLLNINYFGICRFSISIISDAKYIIKDIEDVKDAYFERQYAKYETFDFRALDCFSLTYKQSQILHSLKYHKVVHDIEKTKKSVNKKSKSEWLIKWNNSILDEMKLDTDEFVLYDQNLLYRLLNEEVGCSDNLNWLYLIVLELYLFNPYYPFNVESSKEFKNLKLNSNYLTDKFYVCQTKISKDNCNKIIKAYHKSISELKNQKAKIAIGASVTTVATLATGGLAWFFAPQIAVLLAGGSFAGLYGASLTSASLALIGGGSLAAGGLGMAGGTVIIAGGGALLGVTGATTLSSLLMTSSKVYTLNECAKIITFSKEVLLQRNNDLQTIKSIQKLLVKKIYDTKIEIDTISNSKEASKKEMKQYLNNCKKSLQYLEKCSSILLAILKDAKG